jgi:hypothetical protein
METFGLAAALEFGVIAKKIPQLFTGIEANA